MIMAGQQDSAPFTAQIILWIWYVPFPLNTLFIQKKAPQGLQENIGAPRFSGLKIGPRKYKNRGDWVKQRNKWLNGDTMRKWILLWRLNVLWEEEVVGPSGAWDAPEFAHWWTMFCWLDDVAEVKEIYEECEIPNSSGRMIVWNIYRVGNR